MRFNLKYLLLAVALFLIEVLIATELKDFFFIRAYLGDVIVVMVLYYLVLAFIDLNKTKLIIGIFIFSSLVEFAQYFHFAEILGFRDNKMMMIVLGNSFSWIDILCYGAGCVILYLVEMTIFTHTKIGKAA